MEDQLIKAELGLDKKKNEKKKNQYAYLEILIVVVEPGPINDGADDVGDGFGHVGPKVDRGRVMLGQFGDEDPCLLVDL